MKPAKDGGDSILHDAAIAAANVIVEEFCPHAPNGIAEAVHERVVEIVEAAMVSAERVLWHARNEPSQN